MHCFYFLGKMHFQRSCRTDKHVSAARQVISFKMSEFPNAVQLINALLPKSIRVHDFVKTTKGFDCKKWASSRIYNYIVPSYCFQHKDEVNMEQLKAFRSDEALVNRINEVLQHYYGKKHMKYILKCSTSSNNCPYTQNLHFRLMQGWLSCNQFCFT